MNTEDTKLVISPRLCLCMAALASLFWFTSWPYIRLGDFHIRPLASDFPNCVSARWDNDYFAVGHLSHRRVSRLFITTDGVESGKAVWDERGDGHFCGFAIPPYGQFALPDGFGVYVSKSTLGWGCPYWLMVAFWTVLLIKARLSFRYRIFDLLLAMTVFAIAISLIRFECALFSTAFLNLATGLTLVYTIVKPVYVSLTPKSPS